MKQPIDIGVEVPAPVEVRACCGTQINCEHSPDCLAVPGEVNADPSPRQVPPREDSVYLNPELYHNPDHRKIVELHQLLNAAQAEIARLRGDLREAMAWLESSEHPFYEGMKRIKALAQGAAHSTER